MRLTRAATVMSIISIMGLLLSGCTSPSTPPDPIRSYSVQGVVTRAYGGQGLSDVTLLCGAFGTTTTASDGTWAMDGLKGRVIITPAKDGWSFAPASAEVSDPCTVNFVATPVGTPVGGEITTDVIWTQECSPYILTSNIQVRYGGALTIEPGVIVEGNGLSIEVRGSLRAVGTEVARITFNNTHIEAGKPAPYPEPALIDVEFANINYGVFLPYKSPEPYVSLVLRDCQLTDIGRPFAFTRFFGHSIYIERNIFRRTGGIEFSVVGLYGIVSIRNNAFGEQSGDYAIQLRGSNNVAKPEFTVIEYNSFLSADRVNVSLFGDGQLNAAYNYWNTTDIDAIAKRIFILEPYTGRVTFEPFLEAPHPDTPAYPF